jgi:hypothetical protein
LANSGALDFGLLQETPTKIKKTLGESLGMGYFARVGMEQARFSRSLDRDISDFAN